MPSRIRNEVSGQISDKTASTVHRQTQRVSAHLSQRPLVGPEGVIAPRVQVEDRDEARFRGADSDPPSHTHKAYSQRPPLPMARRVDLSTQLALSGRPLPRPDGNPRGVPPNAAPALSVVGGELPLPSTQVTHAVRQQPLAQRVGLTADNVAAAAAAVEAASAQAQRRGQKVKSGLEAYGHQLDQLPSSRANAASSAFHGPASLPELKARLPQMALRAVEQQLGVELDSANMRSAAGLVYVGADVVQHVASAIGAAAQAIREFAIAPAEPEDPARISATLSRAEAPTQNAAAVPARPPRGP
jgi:hypothetical protein